MSKKTVRSTMSCAASWALRELLDVGLIVLIFGLTLKFGSQSEGIAENLICNSINVVYPMLFSFMGFQKFIQNEQNKMIKWTFYYNFYFISIFAFVAFVYFVTYITRILLVEKYRTIGILCLLFSMACFFVTFNLLWLWRRLRRERQSDSDLAASVS
jgi:hypothetical protein